MWAKTEREATTAGDGAGDGDGEGLVNVTEAGDCDSGA